MGDALRLRGRLLLVIAAACGGKVADDAVPVTDASAPVDAGIDTGACPTVCYSPRELRAKTEDWACTSGGAPSPAPAPAFDGNGCMDITALGAEHCCGAAGSSSCTRLDVKSGPRFTGADCCYEQCGTFSSAGSVGRPLLIEGAARVAPSTRRADWSAGFAIDGSVVGDATREALARAWLDDARLEHASVGSFARFALHLLALGAPPDLVAGAHRAAIDEIEHARMCFGLASRYARASLGPGSLDVTGALGVTSLEDAVVAAVREGCVGETIAAHVARVQLRGAADPGVRRVLESIAADEERHAALAWRFVAWAMNESRRAGPSIVGVAREAFASEARRVRATPRPVDERTAIDLDAWRAHGRLGIAETAREIARAVDEIVEPCARALFAS